MLNVLLIDNYDSFVHNLGRYFRRMGSTTHVIRNDKIDVSEIRERKPDVIVMSPGPCAPQQAGCCLEVVRELHQEFPILGVCLGHQVIAEAFGGHVVRASKPVHGRASTIMNDGKGSFADLPESFLVGRYHSLVANPTCLPKCLEVTAQLSDGTIMAIRHRQYPIVGWQFHPESVLTEFGYDLLRNFLANHVGQTTRSPALSVSSESELHCAIPKQPDWFERAIEFPG